MAFPFPATAEVRLAGGEGFVYRLHLGSSPEAVCLTRGPIKEPPGDTSFEIPFIHATRYSQPGEIHRFRFKAAKGETIEVQGTANAVGSPVDLWLAVEDASGKELTRSDDAPNTTDPRLEWTAPADGDYRIVAGNLLAGAGLHHTYEISARQLTPDFKANFKTSSVAAVPGQTNTVILITDRMRGHTNQLTLEFAGLPEGVTVSPLEVPAKGGELTLNFVTGTEVAPTNTLLRVTVKDLESGTTRPIGAELTSSTVDNGVPGGFTELLRPVADGLWLTVRPKPPEKPPAQTP
jgi:hypothetical protein